MKKITSLLLALTMLCSLSISALAAHTTTVTYTGTSGESYTLTVPATLTPGASGEVKANGTWASNRKLIVTAPSSVTLTNSIDGGTKTLDVTFDGINQAGNDTVAQTVTKDISVGNISNALFGTWTGIITYNVSIEDNDTIQSFSTYTLNYTLRKRGSSGSSASSATSSPTSYYIELSINGPDSNGVTQAFAQASTYCFPTDNLQHNIATILSDNYSVIGEKFNSEFLTWVDGYLYAVNAEEAEIERFYNDYNSIMSGNGEDLLFDTAAILSDLTENIHNQVVIEFTNS